MKAAKGILPLVGNSVRVTTVPVQSRIEFTLVFDMEALAVPAARFSPGTDKCALYVLMEPLA